MFYQHSAPAMWSARKIDRSDFLLIEAVMRAMVAKQRKRGGKALYRILDVGEAMRNLYSFDHAYIVNDCYLVVYEVGCPWYTREVIVQEQLVLQLAVGGDFAVVTAFLENARQEAGAAMAVAGTALAQSDRALASMYQHQGWEVQALTLVKEP